MASIDHASLLRLLSYSPDTGEFKWRMTRGSVRVGDVAGTNWKGRYIRIKAGPSIYLAHRLAFFYMTGQWPKALVDHIDGDGLNNRWANLREATACQNHANSRMYRNNKSGFKGVAFHKPARKFRAQIRVNGKSIYLGLRDTAAEAHELYLEAALKHFNNFARSE